MPKLERHNLIFLVYARNSCRVEVFKRKPKGVILDIERRKWRYDGKSYKICWSVRHCELGCRFGITGVYDQTNINHLRQMVVHIIEAVKPEPNTV